LQTTQLYFTLPCGHGLHSAQFFFSLPCGQGLQSAQSCFTLPCGHGLHSAQFFFSLPCGQGLQSAQLYFTLPCAHLLLFFPILASPFRAPPSAVVFQLAVSAAAAVHAAAFPLAVTAPLSPRHPQTSTSISLFPHNTPRDAPGAAMCARERDERGGRGFRKPRLFSLAPRK
jgi:hypothetical protein